MSPQHTVELKAKRMQMHRTFFPQRHLIEAGTPSAAPAPPPRRAAWRAALRSFSTPFFALQLSRHFTGRGQNMESDPRSQRRLDTRGAAPYADVPPDGGARRASARGQQRRRPDATDGIQQLESVSDVLWLLPPLPPPPPNPPPPPPPPPPAAAAAAAPAVG